MGNDQSVVTITSCGLFEARKQSSWSSNILIQSMDKSLYIDQVSIDDNRNIKKLYSIMDLARLRITIEKFIQSLLEAYEKLSSFHRKNKRQVENKWIVKNSQGPLVNLSQVNQFSV